MKRVFSYLYVQAIGSANSLSEREMSIFTIGYFLVMELDLEKILQQLQSF